jgi:transcriptional regulator with XRE-family HTH domain
LSSLGETISAIRQRLGKTMVEFARLVGSDHTSVSRYESGQIVPGKPILILLLLLAQGDEKPALVKALGLRDDDETQRAFEGALASLLEYERQATRSRGKARKDAGLTEFVKEAAAIANARLSLDPVVAEVLRRLRVSNADRRVQTHFRNFLTYLDIAMPHPKSGAAKEQATGRQRRTKS